MLAKEAFGRLHPLVNMTFFVCAISFCVLLRHPAFQAMTVVLAFVNCLSLGCALGKRTLGYLTFLFLVLALANPLFNPMGETVLFTYFDGRNFTLESLAFGLSSAALLLSVLLWFMAFNLVMTGEKLMYLFGGLVPSLSLVLVMTFRLIPLYRARLGSIASAREGMRSGKGEGGFASELKDALLRVSVLLTWAFEGAVETADSMRSRGYGMGKRSRFSPYRFDSRDAWVLASMLVLAAVVVYGVLYGASAAQYLPSFDFAGFDVSFLVTLCSYGLLLSIPVFVNLGEGMAWRASLSKI